MSNGDGRPSIGADIAYNDYVLLICRANSEWLQHRTEATTHNEFPPMHMHRRFGEACFRFRSDMARAFGKFRAANNGEADPIADFLLNPMTYCTVGAAGHDLLLTCMDDMDDLQQLLTEVPGRFEEVAVGMCPELGTILPPDVKKELAENGLDPFREIKQFEYSQSTRLPKEDKLHELKCEDYEERIKKHTDKIDENPPTTHPFQEEMPFVVFTKYKMHGLASIGHALLMQQAIFRAMTRRVAETLHDLAGRDLSPLILTEDIKSTRLCLLDLVGAEEIGTLVFTTNLSVAFSLVAALRSMTYGDVLAECKETRETLQHSQLNQWIMELGAGVDAKSYMKHLSGLHVFHWTQSSVGTSVSALQEGGKNCNGFVEVATDYQVLPGHREEWEQQAVTVRASECALNEETRGYHGFQVGKYDAFAAHAVDPRREVADADVPPGTQLASEARLPLVSTADFLQTLRHNFERFGQANRDAIVLGMENMLMAPVPDTAGKRLTTDRLGTFPHSAPLADLLPRLAARLFGLAHTKDMPRDCGRLSLRELKKGLRESGIPLSVGRTILYLYDYCFNAIGNPASFDVILDLYDTFATFHAVLSEHLPPVTESRQKQIGASVPTLDDDRVRQVSDMVGAMQSALLHRTSKAYPDISFWDMAQDSRGGLNQVVLAADAPMKCALAIVRLFTGSRKFEERRREHVGVLAQINTRPGAECHSLRLGTERNARLAYFNVDVPHLVHVASYYDFFHDGAHLAYNALAEEDPKKPIFSIEDDYRRESVSEIFARTLSQLLVFGDDKKAAWYNDIATFSRSLKGVGKNKLEVIVRLTEALIRCFVPAHLIDLHAEKRKDGVIESHPAKPDEINDIDRAQSEFMKMVAEVGPFFLEFDSLWTNDQSTTPWEYCRRQFRNAYEQVVDFLPSLWEEVAKIYRAYENEEGLGGRGAGMPTANRMLQEISDCLEQGRPVIRSRYGSSEGPERGSEGSREEQGGGRDNFLPRAFVVTKTLYCYIRTIKEARCHACNRPKFIHLPEGREDPQYAESSKADNSTWCNCDLGRWYPFQSERGRVSMFCTAPSARRRRLRKQLAVLKTFWEISAEHRARRLKQMVCDNFPGLAEREGASVPDVE